MLCATSLPLKIMYDLTVSLSQTPKRRGESISGVIAQI